MTGILLAGCSSGGSSQTTAPAAQTQQQTNQSTQQQTNTSGQQPSTTSGQKPSGQGQEGMKKVITRAAAILGVTESALTTAFESAMKEVGGSAGRPGGPGGSDNKTPPSGPPPSGQTGQQGQAPSGSSDMMKSVYAKVATALSLTTEKVQAAFEQAQSELKQ